jgi:hypothetical protein
MRAVSKTVNPGSNPGSPVEPLLRPRRRLDQHEAAAA